jgi:uncharacterized lipoprotein YajG
MKTRMLYMSALAILIFAAQGCTLKPQYLHIDPEAKVTQKTIGAGNQIGLRVSDERGDKKLGEVGDPDRKMVPVTVEEDFALAIYERVKQALTMLGFSVEPYSDTMDRTLDIGVRKLALSSVKKPLTFDTELRAEVGARAVNSTGNYERQFNVRTRMESAAPPYQTESAQLVNTALSQALEDLLSDEQLLALLAK